MKIQIEFEGTHEEDCLQLLNMAEGLAHRFCILTDPAEDPPVSGRELREALEDVEPRSGDTIEIATDEYNRLVSSAAKIHDLREENSELLNKNTELLKEVGELQNIQKENLASNGKLQGEVLALKKIIYEKEKEIKVLNESLAREDAESCQLLGEVDKKIMDLEAENKVLKTPVVIGQNPPPEIISGPVPPAEEPTPADPPQEDPGPTVEALERIEGPEVEKKVKEVRKPKGKPRPERARVFEAAGECSSCALVSCTDAGWYCRETFKALPVDAKRCKKYEEGVPRGEKEPDPRPAPADPAPDSLEDGIKKAAEENNREAPPEAPQSPPPAGDPTTPVDPEPDKEEPATAPEPATDPPPQEDPDEFIKNMDTDPKDPEELRNLIRGEARLCLQNPKLKEAFPKVIRKYTEGTFQDIPEGVLLICLNDLRKLRKPGGQGGQEEIAF